MPSIAKVLDYIKPSVRAITAYHLKEVNCRIKLNQNESPYDLPPHLKEVLLSEFKSLKWNRYPGFTSKLRDKLAKRHRVSSDCIAVGNGSNELLQGLFSILLGRQKKVLMLAPSFKIYEQLASINDAEIDWLEFNSDWSFPVDEIQKKYRENSYAMSVFCSPNSPTGSLLDEGSLQRMLEADNGLVLVDEAYAEFSGITYHHLQQSYCNLIITRTFSKAQGLAGLRLGYLLAAPEIVAELNKAKLPYNVNIFTEFIANSLLGRQDLISDTVKRIVAERDRLFDEIRQIPDVRFIPSDANFFMLETTLSGSVLFGKLAEHDILVRDISRYHPRLKNMVRVTVGTRDENDLFLKALKKSSPKRA